MSSSREDEWKEFRDTCVKLNELMDNQYVCKFEEYVGKDTMLRRFNHFNLKLALEKFIEEEL